MSMKSKLAIYNTVDIYPYCNTFTLSVGTHKPEENSAHPYQHIRLNKRCLDRIYTRYPALLDLKADSIMNLFKFKDKYD